MYSTIYSSITNNNENIFEKENYELNKISEKNIGLKDHCKQNYEEIKRKKL